MVILTCRTTHTINRINSIMRKAIPAHAKTNIHFNILSNCESNILLLHKPLPVNVILCNQADIGFLRETDLPHVDLVFC